MTPLADRLIQAAQTLGTKAGRMRFRRPVTHVYNPLHYAWEAHKAYLRSFGDTPKRVLFLGMNPGPFGMAQTGIPFGEVASVRNWMRITASISRPRHEHPKRPIEGFACARSEVSGRRLWSLFAERFGRAESFFADHFVANYCPLAFLDQGGRNVTPDKLQAAEARRLFAVCDEHLRQVVCTLQPGWIIGVGDFAEKRARLALEGTGVRIGKILHPSPASPAANRDWAGKATRQLKELGIW